MEYTTQEFEKVIQKIDPKFTITANPNRLKTTDNPVGLNNIFYEGRNFDLPVVADVVKDTIDPNYRYTFPNGYASRMWSTPEIITKLETFLKNLKAGKLDDDYKLDGAEDE